MKFFLLLLSLLASLFSNALQDAIDSAKPYSTLTLSSGVYRGNIRLNEKNGGLKSASKYGILVVNKGLFINGCKKLQKHVQVV